MRKTNQHNQSEKYQMQEQNSAFSAIVANSNQKNKNDVNVPRGKDIINTGAISRDS